MTTLTATWTNPTPTARQAPLRGVEVSLAVAQATPVFSAIAEVPAPTTTFTQTSIDPGSYLLRLVVVDVNGVSGAAVDTAFAVAFDAPGTVTSVSVSVA